jgi:hypothetical protein
LDAYAWFAARRGITRETLDAFGVGVDGATVKFPYPEGATKTRVGLEKDDEGGRKFFWDPPGMAGQVPFLPPDHVDGCDRAILVEGETDTMALWQAMPEKLRDKVAIIGLSGTNAWKDRYADELLKDTSRVFVIFDSDDPYENPLASDQTEKSWQKVKKDLGRKARRVVLPQGINDVAEFFQRYDWAALEVLLKKAAEPKRHYKRLDLSQPIPQTDWVVEDLAVGSEAWVVAGDGGVGKSMFVMALALAVAGGDATFLGKRILKSGPVLYVDEENSAALAVQRLNALTAEHETPDLKDTPWLRKPSLTDMQAKNLEYLWYAGVDLLGEPEKLHEEALEIQPVLVVIDSLSRVSIGGEENSNPDMTRLMRAGVIPIARDTGAAVLILHHTDKEGRGVRGATSIRNTSDQTLSIVEADSGRKRIFPSKPRRATSDSGFEIQGDLATDGWLRVVDPYDSVPM